MYIGEAFGHREVWRFDPEQGRTDHLQIISKDEGFVGTLHLTGKGKDYVGYLEWCRGNAQEGGGIKITLEDLVEYLESKAPQD